MSTEGSVCGTGGWTGPVPGDPDDIVLLQATTAYGGIDLSWTFPSTRPFAVAHLLLFRGLTSSLQSAQQIAVVSGNYYFDPIPNNTDVDYFYWIQVVSINGTYGRYNGPASASSVPEIGKIIEQLTNKIDRGLLANALKADIDKINLIESGLLTEVSFRLADDAALSDAFNGLQDVVDDTVALVLSETIARSNAASALANSISDEAITRQNAVFAESTARINAIAAEAQSRSAALTAEANTRQLNFEQETLARTTAITNEASARTAALLTEATTRQAAITNEQTSRQTANASLASDISTLSASVNTNLGLLTAATQTETNARVSGDTANATNISTLAARINNVKDKAGVATDKTLEATLVDNKQIQVDADTALSSTISSLASTVTNNNTASNAAIISEASTRASADTALTTSLGSLSSTVTNNYNSLNTAITSEASTRATAISAEASARDSLSAQLRGSYQGSDLSQITSGFLYSERTARATEDAALSTRINTIVAASSGDFGDLFAAIAEEETARISADNASATTISALTARLSNVKDKNGNVTNKSIEATLVDNKDAQVSADTAISTTVSALQSTVAGNFSTLNSAITSEASTRATADTASATSITGLTARLTNLKDKSGVATNKTIEATIVDDRQSRVDADSALNTSISGLSSTVTGNFNSLTSAITTEASTRATADTANSTSINTISARLTNVKDTNGAATNKTIEATLVDNKLAQTSGDTALATSITNLTSTVANNYSTLNTAITTEATTRASAVSAEASTRSALSTQMRGTYAGTDVTQISSGLIFSERTARVAADSSLQTQLTNLLATVTSDIADLTAVIGVEQTARATGDTAEALSRETSLAQIRGTYAGTDLAQLTSGLLFSERAARVSADSSISTSVTALGSTVTNNYNTLNSAILSEASTRATADTAITSQINSISAQATKTRTYSQTAAPTTGMIAGDLWFDTDDNNSAYRYNGTAWQATSDTRIALNTSAITSEATTRATADTSLATQLATVQASTNVKNRSYRQTTAPTGTLAVGDIWFDSDDSNKSYRYTGTIWEATDDTRIATNASAIQTESTARASADTSLASQITSISAQAIKTRTYSQTTAPTVGMITGDLWFDTDDNNKAYRYNGTAWVETVDTRIAINTSAIQTEATTRVNADSALAVTIAAVKTTADNATVLVQQETTARSSADLAIGTQITAIQTAVDDAEALVLQETNARSAADTALANQINTVQTSLTGNLASAQTTLQTNINTVDGKVTSIGALYTAKVSVNGLVGGFGIYNDGTQVEAGFDVDTFWIGRTNANKRKPFIISGDVVYIDSAAIANASITDAKITTLNASKINAGFISAARINTGSITADKINTNGLLIRDTNGNVILGSGSALNASYAAAGTVNADLAPNIANAAATAVWASVTGTGRPQDNATLGANFDTNMSGKLSASNLATFMDTGIISSAFIGEAAITSAKIGTAEIGTLKLANNAVTVSAQAVGTGWNTFFLNAPNGGVINIVACNLGGSGQADYLYVHLNGNVVNQFRGEPIMGFQTTNYESGAGYEYVARTTSSTEVNVLSVGAGNHAIAIYSATAYRVIGLLTMR